MIRTRMLVVGWLSVMLAAASATTATGDPPSAPTSTPGPVRYTLPNGLLVVLDPLPNRSTVAVVVTVEAGSARQPDGWTGLAHLTEHLMFEGSPAAPGDLIPRLEALGATHFNATTSEDLTRYFEVVPSQRLEQVLWLEAERFAHAMDDLDLATVQEQHRVLDREREQRNLGRQAVWDLVSRALYEPGHPYASLGENLGGCSAPGSTCSSGSPARRPTASRRGWSTAQDWPF
ncbi:MAG: M16 family metallopeptidase [Sandaracinaceae bacterium]